MSAAAVTMAAAWMQNQANDQTHSRSAAPMQHQQTKVAAMQLDSMRAFDPGLRKAEQCSAAGGREHNGCVQLAGCATHVCIALGTCVRCKGRDVQSRRHKGLVKPGHRLGRSKPQRCPQQCWRTCE